MNDKAGSPISNYNVDTNDLKYEGKVNGDGEREGKWIAYNSRNVKIIEGYYKDGSKDSLWKFYEKGVLIKTENYIHGIKDGKESIYSNGNKYDEAVYSKNIESGTHTHYDGSGNLNYTQEYKDGEMAGKFRIYFANKQLSQEGELKDGRNVGIWTEYTSKGKIKLRKFYNPEKSQFREIVFDTGNGDTLSDKIIKY